MTQCSDCVFKIKALEDRIAELEAPRIIRTVWRPVKKPAKGKRFLVTEREYFNRQVLDPALYDHQVRIDTYRRLDDTIFEVETKEALDYQLDPIEQQRAANAPKGMGTRRP